MAHKQMQYRPTAKSCLDEDHREGLKKKKRRRNRKFNRTLGVRVGKKSEVQGEKKKYAGR